MKEIKDNKLIFENEKYPIAIEYKLPKGLNSAEAGVLFDGRADVNDIFSIIYERANKGIIKIEDKNGNFNIIKQKELPENSKEYEKQLFKELCDLKIININKIRIQVLDYCVEKGWIKDYRVAVGNKINGRLIIKYLFFMIITPNIILLAALILFGIYALLYSLFAIIFYHQESLHIEFSGGGGIIGILMMIWPFFMVVKTTLRKISKLKIRITSDGAQLKSQILGYKKYLKQVVSIAKNDIEKEKILIQEGSMANTIALKTNKESNLFKQLKKQYINKRERSYAIQLLKKTYSIKFERYYDQQIRLVHLDQIDESYHRIIDEIYSNMCLFVEENEKGECFIDYKAIFNYIKHNLSDYNYLTNIYRYSIGKIKKELERKGKKVFLGKR